jgi:hypothetical protein
MRSTIAKASFDRRTQTKCPAFWPWTPAAIMGSGRYVHFEECTTNTSVYAAENALKEEAKKPKYSLSLLSIVSDGAQPLHTRLAAALAFKNFIRHNYVVRAIQSALPNQSQVI